MSRPDLYILPYNPKSWRDAGYESSNLDLSLVVDLRDFETRLIAKWGKETRITRDEMLKSVTWIIKVNDEEFAGRLHNDRILYCDPEPEELATDFALWYREYIPENFKLYMFFIGDWNALELTQQINVTMIANFIRNRES